MVMDGNPCPQYPPPPFTEAALLVLQEALVSGEKEIQYADKKIVYHNLADMRKLYTWMYGLIYGTGSLRRESMIYDSGIHGTRIGYLETEEENYRYDRS